MREPRGSYDGSADVLVNGAPIGTFEVGLRGYVEVKRFRTGSGTHASDGLASWEGWVTGGPVDLAGLFGETVTVRTPDGREGQAIVADANGRLVGSGPAPFDITQS